MKIHDYGAARNAAQGDLVMHRLDEGEAAQLSPARVIKTSERGHMRLLEGEVTNHHHEIVAARPEPDAKSVATAAIAMAQAQAAASQGTATLYQDPALADKLPWLTRTDLMIGFMRVEGNSVILRHPEHEAIRVPVGTYYVGRQIESAGAEERVVAD